MDKQHVLTHAACHGHSACPTPCCMSMSNLNVQFYAACPCPCCMDLNMQHGLEHAAWACPMCPFMSKSIRRVHTFLHVLVNTANLCICWMSMTMPMLHSMMSMQVHAYAVWRFPYWMSMSMLNIIIIIIINLFIALLTGPSPTLSYTKSHDSIWLRDNQVIIFGRFSLESVESASFTASLSVRTKFHTENTAKLARIVGQISGNK